MEWSGTGDRHLQAQHVRYSVYQDALAREIARKQELETSFALELQQMRSDLVLLHDLRRHRRYTFAKPTHARTHETHVTTNTPTYCHKP